MKNLFLVLAVALFTVNSFASNEIVIEGAAKKIVIEATQVSDQDEVKTDPDCTVRCGATINGVTIAVSAGNWFMSCETAGRRCLEKLNESVQ